jgi:NAD(P)-dependent dehydrogenase (short-subunit alcohol dehydrogenase family)
VEVRPIPFNPTHNSPLGYLVFNLTNVGSGIGLMAAQSLAANGAKVYITGRRAEALEKAAKSHHPEEYGGSIIPCGPCDVTVKDDLEKLVGEIEKKEGGVDLLVTAAGVSGPKVSFPFLCSDWGYLVDLSLPFSG